MAPCHSCFTQKKVTIATTDPKTKEVVQEEKLINEYVCTTCGVCVKASNTTNLWKHLQKYHPVMYENLYKSSDLKRKAPSSQAGSSQSGSSQAVSSQGGFEVINETSCSSEEPPTPKKSQRSEAGGILPFCIRIQPLEGQLIQPAAVDVVVTKASSARQDHLVSNLTDYLIHSECSHLKQLDCPYYKKTLFTALPSYFDSSLKAKKFISKRGKTLQECMKSKIEAADGVALCFRELPAEDFENRIVINMRFIDKELPVVATLAVLQLRDDLTDSGLEELLCDTLFVSWGILEKQVVSVVVPYRLQRFFDASKKLFPAASIFTCVLEAVNEIESEFCEALAELNILETKVKDVYNFILCEQDFSGKLDENDRINLVNCKDLLDKIKFICDCTYRIKFVADGFKACTIPSKDFLLINGEKEMLLEIHRISKFFLKILGHLKKQTCFPASQFIAALEGLNDLIKEQSEEAMECSHEFGAIFRALIIKVGKTVKCHNDVAIGIASVLDPRMKGGTINPEVLWKVYRVITDELTKNGETQEDVLQEDIASSPEKITVLSRHYLKRNKDGASPVSSGGMNLALKSYLEEKKSPAERTGCLACEWKGKCGHPLYKTAMKYAPAVYSLFGCSSVKIGSSPHTNELERELWRKTIVFVRNVPSNLF